MYYIIEIQDNPGTSHALLYYTEETRNQAMSKFHAVMTYAAISDVPYHTCLVLDEQGKYIARECYQHYSYTPVNSTTEGDEGV